MTPGLACFYGGMVRRKNALNTMMFCLMMMGIAIVLWITVGYSLTFGTDHASIIGDFSKVFLNDVSWEISSGEEVPEMMSALFNMMFAVIAPAIILGSLAERMKFSRMVIFTVAWSFLVYYPLAHMAWGGGLLEQIGSIDFAGSNVIHISTGISGLVAALFLGKRKGYGAMSYHPHNIPLFLIGNWRINFMGRLVLLQLWLCRWRKWNCNFGVCKHSFILGNKYGRLDGNRVDYTKKVYCNGYNDGRNCWFGGYHSW